MIVHFHGHMNDNMGVLERYDDAPGARAPRRSTRSWSSRRGPTGRGIRSAARWRTGTGSRGLSGMCWRRCSGKRSCRATKVGKIVISAHSGGYRPAPHSRWSRRSERPRHGRLSVRRFLREQEYYQRLAATGPAGHRTGPTPIICGRSTATSNKPCDPAVGDRLRFTPTTVDHDSVVQTYFADWLSRLGPAVEHAEVITQHNDHHGPST